MKNELGDNLDGDDEDEALVDRSETPANDVLIPNAIQTAMPDEPNGQNISKNLNDNGGIVALIVHPESPENDILLLNPIQAVMPDASDEKNMPEDNLNGDEDENTLIDLPESFTNNILIPDPIRAARLLAQLHARATAAFNKYMANNDSIDHTSFDDGKSNGFLGFQPLDDV